MRWAEMKNLDTPRLRLRKLTREDIPKYYARLGSSEAVTRYMLFSPHRDLSESVASVEKTLARYEAGGCYRWAVALPEDDSLMGVIELLRFRPETGECSFAYMLGEEFWGRGYGTEVLMAVLDFAFWEMEVAAVRADHMAENAASGAVMRKAGMVPAGVIPGKYTKDGIAHDAVCYSITAEQWKMK